jgi:aryl-alcohol dehydrogenase-like predicted oxidoreductase
MQHRPLGRSGLEVSAVCLGTMTFGEQNTEAEGHAQMDYAVERGVNFLDTAELYPIPPKAGTQGATERIIGSWLKARPGMRDRVIVASKVVGRGENTWFRDDGSPTELSRRQIEEAVDKSLGRLGTDYIDLYQLHWPDRAVAGFGSNPTVFRAVEGPEHPIHEILGVLGDLVTAGKIRHVGLSNESAWGTMRFVAESEARGLPRVQSVQNAYSLLNRTFEVGLAEVAMRENVGLLAYSPLAQGYLSGKYRDGARPAGSRKQLFDRLQRYEGPNAAAPLAAYLDLADEAGLDPARMALAFVQSRPFVTATIIGATTMAQLETDLDAFEAPLPEDVIAAIDAIHLRHQNPCP